MLSQKKHSSTSSPAPKATKHLYYIQGADKAGSNQTKQTHAQSKSTPNSAMICVNVDLNYVKLIPNGAIVPDQIPKSAEVIGSGLKRSNHKQMKTNNWN